MLWAAVVVGVLTLAVSGLTWFANGMSDNPSVQYPVWPTLIGGGLLTALLLLLHFHLNI